MAVALVVLLAAVGFLGYREWDRPTPTVSTPSSQYQLLQSGFLAPPTTVSALGYLLQDVTGLRQEMADLQRQVKNLQVCLEAEHRDPGEARWSGC